MKLHLPTKLRTALMGLAAAAAPFALTVATASSVAVFAGVAQADDLPLSGNQQDVGDNTRYEKVTVSGTELSTIAFTSTNKNLIIDSLSIAEGASLTINAPTCDLVVVEKLSGAGDLTLNRANNNSNWGYALTLKGDNSVKEGGSGYAGAIRLINHSAYNATQVYLMGENSARDAVIDLGNYTTLGVSTETARIAGLTGTGSYAAVISFANPNRTQSADGLSDNGSNSDRANCYNQNVSRDTNDGTLRTLVLNGSGEYSYAGRIGSEANYDKLNLTVALQEEGCQTLSGTNYINDLTLTSGDLVLSGTTTVGGEASVGEGVTLSINGNVTVSTTIGNNGTLAFGTNGSLAITGLEGLDHVGDLTYSDTVSESTQNGYANAYCIVVRGAGEVAGLDNVTLHGATCGLTTDGEGNRVIVFDGTGGDYYVNEGTVVYGAAGNNAASGATTGIVLNGGDLTLSMGLTEQAKSGTGIVVNRAATVTINENVTLSSANLAAHAATTLAGGGTYDLGAAISLSENVGLASDWKGVILVDGFDFATGNASSSKLADLANGNSWVALSSCTGYLDYNQNKRDVSCNLNLMKGDALKLTNDSSDKIHVFSGCIAGDGDIVVDMVNGTGSGVNNVTYTFSGDVSNWTGTFKSISTTSDKTFTLKFTGSGNIGANILNETGRTLNVTIAGTGDRTMNGSITNSGTLNLTVQEAGKKTFANTVEASSISISGGAVDFNAAVATGTLTVGAATTMSGLTLSGTATLNASLAVTGGTTLSGGSASISLGDDVTFTTGNETVTGLATGTAATISGTGLVSVATEGITYANALIDVTAASDISTINAILSNSRVVNSHSSSVVEVSAGSLADGTNDVTAAEGNITINNVGDDGVTVKNLTVQEGNTISASTADGGGSPATINVAGMAALENGSTVGGSVTIADSGTLVIGGTGFSADGFGAMVEGTLTANATAISLAEGSKIDVTGITTSTTYVLATALGMDIAGDFAVGNFYTGTLAEGMSVSVSVVQPTGSGTYAVDTATASQLVLTLTAADPGTLTQTAVAENGVSVNGTNITLTVTDSLAGVTGGFNVTVGEEAWQAIVDGMVPSGGIYQNATVTLTDGSNTLDWSSAEGPVTLNKYAGTGTKGEYFVAYIPEPATATLSLLALAALAARRRRK